MGQHDQAGPVQARWPVGSKRMQRGISREHRAAHDYEILVTFTTTMGYTPPQDLFRIIHNVLAPTRLPFAHFASSAIFIVRYASKLKFLSSGSDITTPAMIRQQMYWNRLMNVVVEIDPSGCHAVPQHLVAVRAAGGCRVQSSVD